MNNKQNPFKSNSYFMLIKDNLEYCSYSLCKYIGGIGIEEPVEDKTYSEIIFNILAKFNWEATFDDVYNIVSMNFGGTKIEDVTEYSINVVKTIAPYVQNGSGLEVYYNGKLHLMYRFVGKKVRFAHYPVRNRYWGAGGGTLQQARQEMLVEEDAAVFDAIEQAGLQNNIGVIDDAIDEPNDAPAIPPPVAEPGYVQFDRGNTEMFQGFTRTITLPANWLNVNLGIPLTENPVAVPNEIVIEVPVEIGDDEP